MCLYSKYYSSRVETVPNFIKPNLTNIELPSDNWTLTRATIYGLLIFDEKEIVQNVPENVRWQARSLGHYAPRTCSPLSAMAVFVVFSAYILW